MNLSIPILESDETNPINTYGETKVAMEKMIKCFEQAYGINYVSLRYFNAAGAHESGTIGEDHHPETHFDSTDSSSSAWETRQQIRGANKSVYTYYWWGYIRSHLLVIDDV